MATPTNAAGAAEVAATIPMRSVSFGLRGFCRGDEDTWWILTSSYGQGGNGQCTGDSAMFAVVIYEATP